MPECFFIITLPFTTNKYWLMATTTRFASVPAK